MKPVKVLLVDGRPESLHLLSRILSHSAELALVGTASTSSEALEKALALQPDVILTDSKLPSLEGLEFVRQVMNFLPRPILVVDADISSPALLGLLEAGAVEVFPRPNSGNPAQLEAQGRQLVRRIQALSRVRVLRRPLPAAPCEAGPPVPESAGCPPEMIVIGASTGGPLALVEMVTALPADFPVPLLCVQHISPGFLAELVGWLRSQCGLGVEIARDREIPRPGMVYFAPEDCDLEVDEKRRLRLVGGGGSQHRPSIDVTMVSVARRYGPASVGILLSGMGVDGARGLRAIAAAGGRTFVQDEKSCAVFGMPGKAIEMRAAQKVLPPAEIARCLREISAAGAVVVNRVQKV